MHTTNLRKVGGSIMLAVPPAILDILHLEVGTTVGLAVDGDRLLVKSVQPQPEPEPAQPESCAVTSQGHWT